MYEINRLSRLSHALVHFVIDRASLFTDHKISYLQIRAKYRHSERSVNKLWTVLQQIHFLLI